MNRIIEVSDKVQLGINSSYGKGLHLSYIQMFGIPYSKSPLEANNVDDLIKSFIRSELKFDLFANIDEYIPTDKDIKSFFKYFLIYIRQYKIPSTLLDFNNIDELINELFMKCLNEIDFHLNYDNILDSESRINIKNSLYGENSCYLSLIDCEIKNSYFKEILKYKEMKNIIRVLYLLSKSKILSSHGILESCLENLFNFYKFTENKKSVNLCNKNGIIEVLKNFNLINLLNALVSDIRYLKHGKNRFHIDSFNSQQKLKELLN